LRFNAAFCEGAVDLNRLDLEGRVAVITGAGRGIGYAIAEQVLRSGGTVALWDSDASSLEHAKGRLEELGRAVTCAVDVTQEDAVKAATQATLTAFGTIDILINNAGITGGNAATWELDPQVWRRVIDVNLVGPYLTSRSIVPVMLSKGYGRIVNVASVAGKEGNPNASHYSASKAGLIGLTKSLAKELATRGILVNCVTPAAANTDLFAQMSAEHIAYMRSKIPMNRFVEPREIAALVCWLASEGCSFSTGAVFDISGGRATY
jgi:NAD(P)-dependent dehydrogenase (short-subunit alcohol dehydrogenase family)